MSPRKEGIPWEEVKLLQGEAILQVEIGLIRRPYPFIGLEAYRERSPAPVIVELEWGLDIGRLVGPWEQQKKNIMGRIVRFAERSDMLRLAETKKEDENSRIVFEECVKNEGLEMKLLRIEHSLELKKTTFYYEAEGRVDFRKLVKVLAGRLRRRIELYQVDEKEAFLLKPTIGPCGMGLCCQRDPSWYERKIPSRAVRVQRLGSAGEKILGICGKAKCCLLYEVETYQEFYDTLAKGRGGCFVVKEGADLPGVCPGCRLKVLDWNVVANKVQMEVTLPKGVRQAEKTDDENQASPESKTLQVDFEELKEKLVKIEE